MSDLSRVIFRVLTLSAALAFTPAVRAQDQTADRSSIEGLFTLYAHYLSSGNSDAISIEIFSEPALVPLAGGKRAVFSTAPELAQAWKSFLDGSVKKGFKSTEVQTIDIAFLDPDTATANVSFVNHYVGKDVPVLNKWFYVLQKVSSGWRVISVLHRT
jgi:hypothetical protein